MCQAVHCTVTLQSEQKEHFLFSMIFQSSGEGNQITIQMYNGYMLNVIYSVQFSSVAQSCLTLCDPMNCSMPGLPVYHQLPEFTQPNSCSLSWWCHPTISSSVIPFSCPQSFPASGSFQMSQLFTSGDQSIRASTSTSVLPMKTPRIDLLYDILVGSPCSLSDPQESSPAAQFKSINSSVLSFLHSPTFPSIHDHWKNYILD